MGDNEVMAQPVNSSPHLRRDIGYGSIPTEIHGERSGTLDGKKDAQRYFDCECDNGRGQSRTRNS